MPSTLQNFKTEVETAFAGASPESDGGSLAYRFIDDFVEERGGGRHRELIWELAQVSRTVGEHAEQREWELPLVLFIHRKVDDTTERTLDAFRTAVENEATALALVYNRLTDLGTGVLEGELVDFTTEEIAEQETRGPRAGGVPRVTLARVTFNFRVLCQES